MLLLQYTILETNWNHFKKQVFYKATTILYSSLTHVVRIWLIKSNVSEQSISCPSAQQMSRRSDFREKSKKMHDTLFSTSHIYNLPLTSRRRPTTSKKRDDDTHQPWRLWEQQWQLSRNNQPEIAITPASSTYLVAIVWLIVAIASIIDPWSRLLSRIHLGHLNAAESTQTRSLAARSLTFPCSDLLELHADGWFVVKKCAARLSDMWICEC